MPTFGGYAPFPSRLGGSGPSLVEGLTLAMNESRGTAYDTSVTSPIWVENHAIARCLASVWTTNERLSRLHVVAKTSVLERWEAIFGVTVSSAATLTERRRRLADIRARTGFIPKKQALIDKLTPLLSPLPFTLETTEWDSPYLQVSYPTSWRVFSDVVGAPIPLVSGLVISDVTLNVVVTTAGTKSAAQVSVLWTVDGAETQTTASTASDLTIGSTGLTLSFPEGDYESDTHYTCFALVDGWTSSVASIQIVTDPPSWMSDADYLSISARAFDFLDSTLPAWVTFSVVRGDIFRLDVPQNLDRLRLG